MLPGANVAVGSGVGVTVGGGGVAVAVGGGGVAVGGGGVAVGGGGVGVLVDVDVGGGVSLGIGVGENVGVAAEVATVGASTTAVLRSTVASGEDTPATICDVGMAVAVIRFSVSKIGPNASLLFTSAVSSVTIAVIRPNNTATSLMTSTKKRGLTFSRPGRDIEGSKALAKKIG